MPKKQNQPFQLSFNRFLRVDFQRARVTSDGGLLAVRELDERLGLTGLSQNHLADGLEVGLGTRRGADLPGTDALFHFRWKHPTIWGGDNFLDSAGVVTGI